MPDHTDPAVGTEPNNAHVATPKKPSADEVRASVADLLRGRTIVRNRSYILRNGVPEGLSTGAYAIQNVDVVEINQTPKHIRMLRETRGEARGLIPAERSVFQLLKDNGIVGERVSEAHERRYVVMPAHYLKGMVNTMIKRRLASARRYVTNAASKKDPAASAATTTAVVAAAAADDDDDDDAAKATDCGEEAPGADLQTWVDNTAMVDALDDFMLVGAAVGGEREDPAYVVTLGEATLKSKMHLITMSNALLGRIQQILGPPDLHWVIVRRGDAALHILPVKRNFPAGTSTVEARQIHPIDLDLLALVPGIARIYDPWTVPARITEARATLAEIDAAAAERVRQGLPADPEYDPENPGANGAELILDSHGRPVRYPVQYRRLACEVAIRTEEKRAKHRLIWGEVACDGTGGLPQSRQSKVLCLMSGGIDSPVAAFQMMNRGCTVDFVHFLNSTSDTAAILTKLTLIAQRMSRIQGRLELRIVDIAELQNAIIGAVGRAERTVVYKQYMLLIAAAIAGYELLITGDSVSQVASQTVSNVSTLYPLTPKAVVSPCSGSNKNDVIDVSRKVGLFELSGMEGADCCQYLMCKTGATLCMGPSKMRHYLTKITGITALPVKVLCFDNGEALPEATFHETVPFENIKACLSVSVGQAFEDALGEQSPRAHLRQQWLARKVVAKAGGEPDDDEAAAAADDDEVDSPAAIVASDAPPAKPKQPVAAADPVAAAVALAEKRKKQPVYMDSAAATIVDPAVQDAISRAPVGNPNSLHTVGRVCRAAVEGVRHQLLSFLCPSLATPFKLAFTSGGTEANNIAIAGLASLLRTGDEAMGKPKVLLYSAVAHPSVTEVCKKLAGNGAVDAAHAVPVRPDGHLDAAALEALLSENSAFRDGGLLFKDGRGTQQAEAKPWANVAVIFDLVNHELGTLRDGAAIAKLCRAHGALVHADACQALCKVDVDATLFDGVAVTAHKINGPTGIGAVAIRGKLVPCMECVMAGGSFDGDVRPGTLNAPGIVGFGAALSLNRDETSAAAVFEHLLSAVEDLGCDTVRVNGTPRQSSGRILHMTLTGASNALRKMDDAEIVGFFATKHNVMLSTGAACSQHKAGSSAANLYTQLGVPAGPTLRVSIDHNTSKADVNRFLTALGDLLKQVR